MKINIEDRHQVFRGPDHVTITLDADEIYPDDPGMGTPMMVEDKMSGGTATLACAADEGETDGGRLSVLACAWLSEMEPECDAWLNHHTKMAKGTP